MQDLLNTKAQAQYACCSCVPTNNLCRDVALEASLRTRNEHLEALSEPYWAKAGALTVKYGHIHPEETAQGYIQAFVPGLTSFKRDRQLF